MADVISIPVRAQRLPLRLVNDGWWLARLPDHPSAELVPFAVRDQRPCNLIPFPIARRPRKARDD
jgi:hypothetical protein